MDDEIKKPKKRFQFPFCKKGPCACFGISLGRGTMLFTIFDLITGPLVFIPALNIYKGMGERQKHYEINEKFKIPRELIIFFIFAGIYTVCTTFLLVLSFLCRNMGACYAWLILNLPLAIVNPIKLYESAIVYWLAQEIMEQDQAINFYFDQVAGGGDTKKKKKRAQSPPVTHQIIVERRRISEA